MIVFAKRIQQDLHHWTHWAAYAKGRVFKDGNGGDWWYFYKLVAKKPPVDNEKIVDMFRLGDGGTDRQLWALYNEI